MNRESHPRCEFGPFVLDPSEHLLLRDGQPISLTPKVFDLLCVLIANSGHLVEKDQLLTELWSDSFVEEANLNRSVSVLRKVLGDHPGKQKYIETVPKLGYRFVAPVTMRAREGGPREQDQLPSAVRPGTGSVLGRPSVLTLTITVVGIVGLSLLVYKVAGGSVPRRAAVRAPTPVHRQVTFTGNEGTPTLSPDSQRIAYVSSSNSTRTIVVRDLTDGQPLEVFTGNGAGFMRWSPDGNGLLFWGRTDGSEGVFVASQPGGSPRLIAGGRYVACWSPDGSTIAVASYLVGKIAFLDPTGREQRSMALEGIHSWVWDIDWSPHNKQLLLVSNDDDGRFTIWTVGPDGRNQRAVLEDRAEIASARWAPGGEAIYYFRRENQTVSLNKLVVRPDQRPTARSPVTLLTGLETDRTFGLSSDGRRLVYTRAPYHSNLWLLDLGNSDQSQAPETRELTQSTSLIERPRVSPDGSSILFNIGHAPPANLYTMPITGGVPRPLTRLDSYNVGGAWSPDGKRIAFASTQSGTPHVWTIDAEGGLPRVLSSTQMSDSFDLAWAPGSRPVSGDGKPQLRRARSGDSNGSACRQGQLGRLDVLAAPFP
jgi:Tol biopolymer transport system component/DNA-binding winged helix-turn-helix (wHTH) protein